MVSNGDVAVEGPSLPKMNFMEVFNLAEQFVLQYYTVMYKCPELLHRFYGEDSTLIYESSPIRGQADIHNTFCKLNLVDTRVIVLKIDALKAHDSSALIQVCGEISSSGGPFRRFMRSFTLLEKNPADFYVLSDIFRYQDRVYIPKNADSKVTQVKELTRSVPEKNIAQAPPNCVVHEQKHQAPEKGPEVPQLLSQKMEAQKKETLLVSRVFTSKSPVESVPQKVVEKQTVSPVAQEQPTAPPPPLRQSPQLPQQQPVSSAPMSWAQRASGNVTTVPVTSTTTHRPQTQPAKPVTTENSMPNAPIGGAQKGGPGKQMRGGGRSHQADFRRDWNVDRRDTQPPYQQSRGGFAQSGGVRSDMRGGGGGGGGTGRGRGASRGGSNRGEGNVTPRR